MKIRICQIPKDIAKEWINKVGWTIEIDPVFIDSLVEDHIFFSVVPEGIIDDRAFALDRWIDQGEASGLGLSLREQAADWIAQSVLGGRTCGALSVEILMTPRELSTKGCIFVDFNGVILVVHESLGKSPGKALEDVLIFSQANRGAPVFLFYNSQYNQCHSVVDLFSFSAACLWPVYDGGSIMVMIRQSQLSTWA